MIWRRPLLLRRGAERSEAGWSKPDHPVRSRWSRPPLLKRRGRVLVLLLLSSFRAQLHAYIDEDANGVTLYDGAFTAVFSGYIHEKISVLRGTNPYCHSDC